MIIAHIALFASILQRWKRLTRQHCITLTHLQTQELSTRALQHLIDEDHWQQFGSWILQSGNSKIKGSNVLTFEGLDDLWMPTSSLKRITMNGVLNMMRLTFLPVKSSHRWFSTVARYCDAALQRNLKRDALFIWCSKSCPQCVLGSGIRGVYSRCIRCHQNLGEELWEIDYVCWLKVSTYLSSKVEYRMSNDSDWIHLAETSTDPPSTEVSWWRLGRQQASPIFLPKLQVFPNSKYSKCLFEFLFLSSFFQLVDAACVRFFPAHSWNLFFLINASLLE